MITLRSIFFYLGPILVFALLIAAGLTLLFPRPDAAPAEALGFLWLLSLALCGYGTRRLRPCKAIPDLRLPYFLNAAAFSVIIGVFALGISITLWETLLN